MRTLVSGGTGFVGRFIVERLLQAGHEVVLWGRSEPPPGLFPRAVDFAEGALDPDTDFRSALAGVDFLVHAAFDHVPGKFRGGEGADRDGFIRRNRDGSIALFEAARRAGVRRAVFLSSRAVYGAQTPGLVLAESTEPHPDTLYGSMKLDVERAIAAMRDTNFEPVSLRVTGVYGPAGAGREHKWVGLFGEFLAGRPIEPRVATEVHGADVAEAVRLVLEEPPLRGVFNVSDLVLDRRDLLELVQSIARTSHPLPPRADATGLNVMDMSRLQTLGWRGGGWPELERTVRSLLAERESR